MRATAISRTIFNIYFIVTAYFLYRISIFIVQVIYVNSSNFISRGKASFSIAEFFGGYGDSLYKKDYLLHILISKANNVFHYENDLEPDGSNFKLSTASNMKTWILYCSNMAAEEKKNLVIVLKIQDTMALSDNSKRLIEFIKGQQNYKLAKLTGVEKEMIRISEESMNSE